MRLERETYEFSVSASTRAELERLVEQRLREFWGNVSFDMDMDVTPIEAQSYAEAHATVINYRAEVTSRRRRQGDTDGLTWGE